MKRVRAVLALALALSVIGAAQRLCQAPRRTDSSCCQAPCHSAHHKTSGSACAQRCASPSITVQGVSTPSRLIAWALVAHAPRSADARPAASPSAFAVFAPYQPPPPGGVSGRSPPAC